MAFAAWLLPSPVAWTSVVAATAVWFGMELLAGGTTSWAMLAWNAVSHGTMFSGAVMLLQRARNQQASSQRELRTRADDQRRGLLAAIEQSSDLMMIADLDGAVQYVNAAFEMLTGYRRDEVVGRPLTLLTSDAHGQDFHDSMWDVLRAGQAWRAVLVNRRKDGSLYDQDSTIFPLTDSQGTATNYVCIGRDVTRERERAAQLSRTRRMDAIGRLAGGIAHDFNNQLMVILGSAEAALDYIPPGHPSQDFIHAIQGAGDRAARVTRQLLAFGRSQVLQPQALDLNMTLSTMRDRLAVLVGTRARLQIVLDKAPGVAYADPLQIEEVIAHLVQNACDAMPDGGTLTIETGTVQVDRVRGGAHAGALPGPYIMLEVRDTGTGMDRQTQAHLFEPFFTTKNRAKARGLGLATVFGIVEQSGGHLSVESEVGRGSTFRMFLPDVGRLSPWAARDVAAVEVPRGSETILVAEDDPAVRAVMERFLRNTGYTVLLADTPDEALGMLSRAEGPIDLLVTDVLMPMMGGKAIAQRLAAIRPSMKVLYVSGYSDDVLIEGGVLQAGTPVLLKPFSQRALAQKVREILDAGAAPGPTADPSEPAHAHEGPR